MNDPPDEYIITQKDRLDNIIRDFSPLANPKIISDVVYRVQQINIHTFNVLKAFFLCLFENDSNFPFTNKDYYPKINERLLRIIMNSVTKKIQTKGKSEKKDNLYFAVNNFVDEHYRPLLKDSDIICRDNLKHILNYEEKIIITNIKNNIKEHYISHIKFFIRIYFKIDDKIKNINENRDLNKYHKKDKINSIYKKYNDLVKDVLNPTLINYISKEKYHDDIAYLNLFLVPVKNNYRKKSIEYDVKANPLDYLPNLIALNKELERINDKMEEGLTPYRLFNVLPLRRSLIPKYITIDTVSLISLFIKDYQALFIKYENNQTLRKTIWNVFFDLNKNVFHRKGYTFNYRLLTDGVTCSISMILLKNDNTPVEKLNKYVQKQRRKFMDTIKETYIDEIPITTDLLNRKPVYLDVGKKELFTAMIETHKKDKKYEFFSYTRCQRNKDTKAFRYYEIRSELANTKIGSKTIKEIEDSLNKYNSKTGDFEKFKKYMKAKIIVNRLLKDHYKITTFRKLQWNTYNNTRRSEDLMIERFKKIMGNPKNVYIILGDYSDLGLKGSKSSITKKIRKIFQNHGYDVYLIDEYKTSKICSCCGGEVENFVMRTKGKYAGNLIWKLVRCKICKSIHNRDHNATKNFRTITKSLLAGNGRPKNYERPPIQDYSFNIKREKKQKILNNLRKIIKV